MRDATSDIFHHVERVTAWPYRSAIEVQSFTVEVVLRFNRLIQHLRMESVAKRKVSQI